MDGGMRWGDKGCKREGGGKKKKRKKTLKTCREKGVVNLHRVQFDQVDGKKEKN